MAHQQLATIPNFGGGQLVAAGEIDEKSGVARTSGLDSPTMLLTGHAGKIYTTRFDPTGNYLASAGHDKQIFIWEVYGKCANVGLLGGHQGAVLQVQWSRDGEQLYSACTDKTAAVWDVQSLSRVKKMKEHDSHVNSICPSQRGEPMLATGSDDGTAKLWDVRRKKSVKTFDCMYQVTSVALSHDGTLLYTGGLDNDIKVWDYRRPGVLYLLEAHTDTITGLSLSPDGSYLISNSMDHTVRYFDVKPYAPQERCLKIFAGTRHSNEKLLLKPNWSPDMTKVACGSSDRFAYVFDTNTCRILYKLPGHDGSVNEVDFHPQEPIIASCGSDKKIYVGEIAA